MVFVASLLGRLRRPTFRRYTHRVMIKIIPNTILSASDIKILRELSSYAISDIRESASKQTPIRCFIAFGHGWMNDRVELVRICEIYKNINSPFYVVDDEVGEVISPQALKKKLIVLRAIELETQMNIDLENGYISHPDEFNPHDEEWV